MARAPQRIFARKTQCRKIEAAPARSFLTANHLWGATKARYYYGLYQTVTTLANNDTVRRRRGQSATLQEERLVAVATFSKCRKVQRGHNNSIQVYHSYELIRYCSLKECTVVGGISKLLKQFIRDRHGQDNNNPHQQPMMDIVTMVDRDWGAATGWEDALKFQSMSILDPLVMVVSGKDKQRRYLVGAGLQHDDDEEMDNDTKRRQQQSGLRPRQGLPRDLLQDLNAAKSPVEAIQLMAKNDFYPVHDAGVERLYMLVDPLQQTNQRDDDSKNAKTLWQSATPKYTTRYYSSNTGIVSLLDYAASGTPPLDVPIHQDALQSWKATSANDATTHIIFSAKSCMDPNATIEICQRKNGWRTMRFVKDPKISKVSSIYHGIWKVDPTNNSVVESEIVIQDHLKTMAVLALMAGKVGTITAADDSGVVDHSDHDPLQFLHFGCGAGTLIRLLAHEAWNSQHTVIELDQAVVEAMQGNTLALPNNVSVITQDAVQFVRDFNPPVEKRYDCVCIDVFDENNFVPEQLYSIEILERLRNKILATDGIIVWNFHTGGKRRAKVLEEASGVVSVIFGNNKCCWVPSLDSTPTGGNAILLASQHPLPEDGDGNVSLFRLALATQIKFGLTFDAAARVSSAKRAVTGTNGTIFQ
eukprot:scaffold35878_cov229-Amphora_coffeaeformis.AAC.1